MATHVSDSWSFCLCIRYGTFDFDAIGTVIPIETFDGSQDVEIKAGSQSGDIVTLKGKGIKHLRHNGRGDLHIRIQVQTPSKIDAKEKELFKKLSELRKGDKAHLAKLNQGTFGRGRRR